jgi:hypothetical protein
MTNLSDKDLVRLLRSALPVLESSVGEDLWPRVRDRIERGAPPPTAGDWILTSLVALLCLLEPTAVRLLLFHL